MNIFKKKPAHSKYTYSDIKELIKQSDFIMTKPENP